MTEKSGRTISSGVAKQIRIPRITIATPSTTLPSSIYLNPAHGNAYSRTNENQTTTSYIADHLQSRRLSEIDSPTYLPTLLSSTAERTPRRHEPIDGYSTAPLRIRTDVTALPRVVDTNTDHREYAGLGEPPVENSRRISQYPATSEVLGLQPPKIVVPTGVLNSESARSVNPLIPETQSDVDRLALFNNPSLGYQRLFFILSKYPAVAMTIIATWMLWGRGLGLNSVKSNENVCYIVSFVCGVFILSSQVILSASHNNSYKRAKILSNLYFCSTIIGILISFVVISFAVISYKSVNAVNHKMDQCTWMDPALGNLLDYYCFTPSERIAFLSIQIASAGLVIILFFFSGLDGCIGQFLMKKKRKQQLKQYAEAHDNAVFRF